MKTLRHFIRTIPKWAFVLVLIVLFVQSANMFFNARMPVSGERENLYDGHWIIDYVKPGGPVDKAGIKTGDTIVSCNSYPIKEWYTVSYGTEAGDTLIFCILRKNVEVGYQVVNISRLAMFPGIYWSAFIFFILVSISSLYILFKKPKDKAAVLYFIYIQGFALIAIGGVYTRPDPVSLFSLMAFLFSGMIMPILLVHFHLIFPRPAKLFSRYIRLLRIIYITGCFVFLIQAGCTVYQLYIGSLFEPFPFDYTLFGIWWSAIVSVLAIAVAVYQLITIRETLARNQLRIIVLGTILGSLFTIYYTFFYSYVNGLWVIYPNLVQFILRASGLVLTICLLIAIFRFRIWEIEIILKKALLYLGATLGIILTYLLLLYLVDLLTIYQTKTTRFTVLAISVIIFMISRDWLQRLIERIFHRETYDSATVVTEFEQKLAGVYRIEDLGSGILEGMNDIFHFNSLILSLKKEKLVYNTAFVLGSDDKGIMNHIEITREFEDRLQKTKVFSPGELSQKFTVIKEMKDELIVPLVKDDQPFGFFVCGQKKSEKTYSMQDIRVLSLIARRVIALFHTAELYQKDLDRQLMLERERARISQDMHDDVGASLTRISILSELAKNKDDVTGETKQWLGQISDTSRGVMEEMSQIIWALNPKNDTLEGLVAYLRRFSNEFLEPTTIDYTFDFPDILPARVLSVEVRRNVYLVVREALHNVVKHSGAMKVLISMKLSENGFKIMIKDDGRGFDPGKLEFPGNGLVNMRKRMNDIGGEIVIGSEIGGGTEIELVVVMG